MDYILFGIQGSGKGTQGKILREKIGAAYFETGQQLRTLSSHNSPLGKKVKSIIDAGHLVPLEVVMEIVEDFVKHNAHTPIIFDGIPRDSAQNERFSALLHSYGRGHTGIYFELSRSEAEYRLMKRRTCVQCKTAYPAGMPKSDACEKCSGVLQTRADDNKEAIQTRLDIFFKETVPVIEWWRIEHKLVEIDASPPIQEITPKLMSSLKL